MIYAGSVAKDKGASISGHGEGIYVLDDSGMIKQRIIADHTGIIISNRDKTIIYAANETRNFGGMNGDGGGITAYQINSDGCLKKINDSLSYGSRPSNLALSEDEKYLIVSNHGSHSTVTCSYVKDERGVYLQRGFDDSSLAVFAIEDSGAIGQLTDLIVFHGSGYWNLGGGQSTAHLHCVRVKNDIVLAANRGADFIEVLRLEKGKLQLLNRFHTRSAYAPRHIVFHPEKNIFFVCFENYPAAAAYGYDNLNGEIKELSFVKTMPEEYYTARPLPSFQKEHMNPGETNTCGFADRSAAMPSDIHISSNGRFLYVSNRYFAGTGNIAIFEIDENGILTLKGHIPLSGHDPRGFMVSEKNILYAGCVDTDTCEVFRLSENTGLVEEKENTFHIPSPSSFVLK